MKKRIKRVKKVKPPLSYRDIPCDSLEEVYFLMWLFELSDLGYVYKIDRCPPIALSNKVELPYTVELVKSTKEKYLIVTREHIYTPEFKIIWNSKAEFLIKRISNLEGLFYDVKLRNSVDPTMIFETWLEIKPKFDQNNMTRLFKINQKWVFDKHGLFVDLVIPETLFEKTFTPKDYLTTPTGKQRKLNYKPKSCQEWLLEHGNN